MRGTSLAYNKELQRRCYYPNSLLLDLSIIRTIYALHRKILDMYLIK